MDVERTEASLEAFLQMAPGNQAVTHIWIALYTNGITFKDEELARKEQQSVQDYSLLQILSSTRIMSRLNS